MGPLKPLQRAGGLLLETLIALTLGAVVLGSLTGLLSSAVRSTRLLTDRAEALEVVRTVWVVLEEEIRRGRAGSDWGLDENGVLRLRSFQGVARICDSDAATSSWRVAYRGRRRPDPERDSILVLGTDGGWRSFDLVASASVEGCEPHAGESVYRWVVAGPVDPRPVLARSFESGSYHLVDGAFRYRRGEGGRQPLTPERLSVGSGFRQLGDALEITVELAGEPRTRPARSFIWMTRPPERNP